MTDTANNYRIFFRMHKCNRMAYISNAAITNISIDYFDASPTLGYAHTFTQIPIRRRQASVTFSITERLTNTRSMIEGYAGCDFDIVIVNDKCTNPREYNNISSGLIIIPCPLLTLDSTPSYGSFSQDDNAISVNTWSGVAKTVHKYTIPSFSIKDIAVSNRNEQIIDAGVLHNTTCPECENRIWYTVNNLSTGDNYIRLWDDTIGSYAGLNQNLEDLPIINSFGVGDYIALAKEDFIQVYHYDWLAGNRVNTPYPIILIPKVSANAEITSGASYDNETIIWSEFENGVATLHSFNIKSRKTKSINTNIDTEINKITVSNKRILLISNNELHVLKEFSQYNDKIVYVLTPGSIVNALYNSDEEYLIQTTSDLVCFNDTTNESKLLDDGFVNSSEMLTRDEITGITYSSKSNDTYYSIDYGQTWTIYNTLTTYDMKFLDDGSIISHNTVTLFKHDWRI